MIPLFFSRNILLARKLVATVGGALRKRFETIQCAPVYLLCYIIYLFNHFCVYIYLCIFILFSDNMFYQLLYMVSGDWRPLSLQDRGDNCSTHHILEFYDFSLLHSDLSGFNHAYDCSALSGICKYVLLIFLSMDYFPTFYSCQLSEEIIVPLRILNLLRNH